MAENKFEKWNEEINQEVGQEKAYLELFVFGEDSQESAIRANKNGLLRFAQKLIQTADHFDKMKPGEDIEFFNSHNVDWYSPSSHIELQFAFKIDESTIPITTLENEKWYDKYVPAAIGITLLICLIVGIITVIKFIGSLF
jgi:hypothetical protein